MSEPTTDTPEPTPKAPASTPEVTGPTRACTRCGKDVPTVAHSCPYCFRWRGDIRVLRGLWILALVVFFGSLGLFVWGVLARRWGSDERLFDAEVLWRSADLVPLLVVVGVALIGGTALEIIMGLKIRASWRQVKEVCAIPRRCEWCGGMVLATAAICPQCHRMRRDVRDMRIASYALVALALLIGVGGFLAGYAAELWHVVPEPETVADHIREVVGTAEKSFSFLAFITSFWGIFVSALTIVIGLSGAVCDLVADGRMYRWRR